MNVIAKVNRADLVLMQLALLFKMPANLYAFVFVWGLIVVLGWADNADRGIALFALASLVVAIPVFLAFLALGILIMIATATEDLGMIGEHRFEITDEGFSEETRGTRTFTKWNGISKIIRSSRYIYVKISMYRIHIIPERAFASKRDYVQFGDALVEHTSAT